ncbi:MAG: hypothetical protein WC369_07405, partial [Dehalococcoidales bacterium]
MKRAVGLVIFLLLVAGCKEYEQAQKAGPESQSPVKVNWGDLNQWKADTDGRSVIEISRAQGMSGNGIQAVYELKG